MSSARSGALLTTFLFSIGGGMLMVLAGARVEQISWKFHRLVGYLVCAQAAGALAASYADTSRLTLFAGILLGFLGGIIALGAAGSARSPGGFRALCAAGGAVGICLAAIQMCSLLGKDLTPLVFTFCVILHTVSCIFLGSITLAWLLGHAYLTATSMTIAPLSYMSRVLFWSVLGRLVLAGVSVLVAWRVDRASNGNSVVQALWGAWLLGVLRVGVGLLLVALFAWMVRDCVRLRATQSATGILYFASVAAYVGELAGLQILRECRWPL